MPCFSLARTGAHTADGRALGLGQHSEAGAACRRPADSPVRVQAGRQREWHWRGFEVLMPEEAPAQMHFTFFFLSGKKSPTRTHLQKREQYTFSGLQIRILTKGHKLESAKDSEVPLKTVGEMWVWMEMCSRYPCDNPRWSCVFGLGDPGCSSHVLVKWHPDISGEMRTRQLMLLSTEKCRIQKIRKCSLFLWVLTEITE